MTTAKYVIHTYIKLYVIKVKLHCIRYEESLGYLEMTEN